jgi:YegS/Rv2252/BmrU family lipid kinase
VTWWVIVNPWAGRTGEIESRTRSALRAATVDHELRVSRSAGHVAELVAEGRAAGAVRFVAVGGDGTLNLVLNAVLAEEMTPVPTLAILPAGSGSDFIRTFALPKDLESGARRLANPETYRCDVGVLQGSFGARYFLNVADVGVAAASVMVADRLPRRLGGIRYAVGFWLNLARFPAREIELEAGGRVYAGRAINVVAANGQFFGGGMNVAPRAALMDGLFDLQVFSGPRRQAFSVMPRVVRGTHLGHPGVTRIAASEFRLTCDPAWPVEADGELLGRGSCTGRVVPGAVDFVI